MFLITLVLIILAAIGWYQIKYRHRNLLMSKIPTPSKYPIIHNAHNFIGKSPKELFDLLESFANSLGPVYVLSGNPFDNGSLIVADPKVAETILSSQKLLDKGEDYERMKSWLGTGLLIATGKKWHQRRKIITPSFHFQILEKFVEIMDEQGKVLISKLEPFDGQQVNIYRLVNFYALDVICESAMGCKMNAQNDESEYVKAVKE